MFVKRNWKSKFRLNRTKLPNQLFVDPQKQMMLHLLTPSDHVFLKRMLNIQIVYSVSINGLKL